MPPSGSTGDEMHHIGLCHTPGSCARHDWANADSIQQARRGLPGLELADSASSNQPPLAIVLVCQSLLASHRPSKPALCVV